MSSSNANSQQTDRSRTVGNGGVLITQDGTSGSVQVVDFRDDGAIAAATELASQSIVSAQDLGRLALTIASRSKDQQNTTRVLIVAGVALVGLALMEGKI